MEIKAFYRKIFVVFIIRCIGIAPDHQKKFHVKAFSTFVVCLGPSFFKTFVDMFSFIGNRPHSQVYISIMNTQFEPYNDKKKKINQKLAPILVLSEEW